MQYNKQISFNLVIITLITILIGLGFIYFIDSLKIKPAITPSFNERAQFKNIILAGKNLDIPLSWFSENTQKNTSISDKINLHFILPLGKNNRQIKIEASLQPLRKTISSANLLDSVYLHQFSNEQKKGVVGLIGKPLKGIEGFRGETVWYDPLSANPFVAKCMDKIPQGQKQQCIRTVAINKQIAITYVFDFEVLQNWKNFDNEANKWLNEIKGL